MIRFYPMKDVKKNGTLMLKDGYELTEEILNMTRQELIEELVGSFEYDYLVENNFVRKLEVFKVRDAALRVLKRHNFAWAENPLHPNHDHMTHANGDELTDEEAEAWLNPENSDEVTHAVWDLANVWATSKERRALVEEYAKNCKFN